MNRYIIALDMGTTNTRAYLVDGEGNIIKSAKRNIGAGETAKCGSKQPIIKAVKECVSELSFSENISAIVASGMITSSLGLKEVPHLTAPVDIRDICENMVCEYFPEISSIPFWFIPGVKNNTVALEEMDMMRGEETETVALMDSTKDALLILPGSHTKFVSVSEGEIKSCLTTLTGELLSVITQNTVAAQAVDGNFANTEFFSKEFLLRGYNSAVKYGMARAVFGTRILRVLSDANSNQAAWYLLGAVLQGDIAALKGASLMGNTAILAGKEPFMTAWKVLLEYENLFKEVVLISNEAPLSAKGAYILAKNKNLI